jgi:DNA polymerase-3 subunit alpha
VVDLVDPYGNVEVVIFSEKLKQIQKMNLDEIVVFKVKITDKDMGTDIFKSIDVCNIMTIGEAKKLSK